MRTAAAIMCCVLCVGCATNPVSKRREFVLMSESGELAVGQRMAPAVSTQYGTYADASVQAYVSRVGQGVATVSDRANLGFHFTVLDSAEVNAFALPGGYVFITRGLLAYLASEAELAAVLGHEIGHVTARHAVRQYTKAASYQVGAGVAGVVVPELAGDALQLADLVFAAIASGYSRQYETEADFLALRYSARAGYDPRATASLLRTLRLLDGAERGSGTYTSLFATHPPTGQRIEAVDRALAESGRRGPFRTGRDEFLDRIDGLVYGANIRTGVVRQGRFVHPDLGLAFTPPPAWELDNRPDAVLMQAPRADQVLVFDLAPRPAAVSPGDAAAMIAAQRGMQLVAGAAGQPGGMEAFVGTYRLRGPAGVPLVARAGFFMAPDRVWCMIGYCRPDSWQEARPVFDRTIASVVRLSPAEAAAIKPQVIRLHRVLRTGSLAALLASQGIAAEQLPAIAQVNGWDPAAPPGLVLGMRVKLIVIP